MRDMESTVQRAPIARLWAQASHDLRQPVQAALLVTRMLEAGPGRSGLSRTAHHIEAALESLQEMLEVLTLLSRIEAGLQMVALRTCELARVLDPTMQEMAEIAAQRGILLRQRNIHGLVRSNPRLLALATRSLLLNAIKFASGQAIVACCSKRGGQLRLEAQFRGASLGAGNEANAFVQLAPSAHRPVGGELGLGPSLLDYLCRRLGHRLHYGKLPRDGQRLAILLAPPAR